MVSTVRRWAAIFFCSVLSACVNGHCRHISATEASVPVNSPDNKDGSSSPDLRNVSVLVAKPDGSLQCGAKKAIDPKDMEKPLVNAGIQIISRSSLPDGLMHIQACGTQTGQLNVYEINEKDLEKADALGFKRFRKDNP